MALDGYSPLLVKQFGGRCTVIPRAALPIGRSPECADVKFVPGGVGTRDGFGAEAFGDSAFTSLSVYLGREGTERVLLHDRTGKIFVEDPGGTLSPVVSDQGEGVMNAVTLFGKQWICVSDGLKGQAAPFYFDGDSIYPAGPEGPSRQPLITVVPDTVNGFIGEEVAGVWAALDADVHPTNPTTATVMLAPPRGASDITIAALPTPTILFIVDASHTITRGLINVVSKDDAARTVTFNVPWNTVATDVTDELVCSAPYWVSRDVRYAWMMKSGYISQLSPASPLEGHYGRCSYDVWDVQTGPPGTVARVFFVKVQIGTELFHVASKMVLNDNTTVGTLASPAMRISFTEDELTTGLSGEPYLNLAYLTPYAGVCAYKERLVFWRGQGEALPRIGDTGIRNGSLNGGVDDGTLFGGTVIAPNGWSVSAGGASAILNPAKGQNGIVWSLCSSSDFYVWSTLTVSGLLRPTRIGLRLRARRDGGWAASDLANGVITATVTAYPSGTVLATGTIQASALSSDVFRTFELTDGEGAAPLVTTATHIEVRLDIQRVTSALAKWLFDDVSFYEVGFRSTSQGPIAITKAGDPESLDATTGYLLAGPDDGQDVGCCFEFRGNLYIAKQRSLFIARDTQGEPIEWPVELVSPVCGTPSVRGAACGDGWVVIAGIAGVFLFDGGAPQLMSYAILPDWQRINWSYGHKLWVMVDTENRIFYIGAPVDGATECNLIFSCDYSQGLDENGRQWSILQRGAAAADIMLGQDGGSRTLFALNLANAPSNYLGDVYYWTRPAGTVVTVGRPDPVGGVSAEKWALPPGGGVAFVQSGLSVAAQACVVSIWMRAVAPPDAGLVTMEDPIPGGTSAHLACDVTTAWQRFVFKRAAAAGGPVEVRLTLPSWSVARNLEIFGPQSQLSEVDQGWAPVGATDTPGVMARLQRGNAEDFDGPIPAYYDTAPIGADIGRSSFERTILRISGEGTLPASLIRPDGVTPVVLQEYPLLAAPNNDLELGGNFQDTQFCIRIGDPARPIRNWFMTKACAWIKPSSYGLFRGKN